MGKPNHFLIFSFFPRPNFFPSSSLPASPRPLRGVQGGPVKILKFSTLEDEFLHHLREFLTSNHTANDDYHLLKLKIKNGETIFSFFHFPHPFNSPRQP